MNNKVLFWILLAVSIILGVVSFFLHYKLSFLGYFMSGIMLVDVYFAKKDVSYYSPLRSYYKTKGNLQKYQNICIIYYVCFMILGVLGFILALVNVL